MRRRTKIAAGTVAALATSALFATVGPWRASFSAAWRAFQQPELVDGRGVAPPRAPLPGAPDESPELDRLLADDFEELSGLSLVMNDEARLSELRPESLPLPVTRRTMRFVKFFSRDARGRRAFEHLLRRAGRYRGRLETALREARLPDDLLWVVAAESNFDPRATSPAGAAGMWQLMPGLARERGLVVSPWLDERRSLDRSTAAAVQHLAHLHESFGAWDLALAAYNMGENGLRDAIENLRGLRAQRGDPPARIGTAMLAQEGVLPRETADYVPKIAALAVVAANLQRFQFDRVTPEPELRGSPITVDPETPLAVVAKAAGITQAQLVDLNPELLEGATPPGRPYAVVVPAARYDRALATLPVYLEEAAEQADGLHDLPAAPMLATTGPVVEPPFRLMTAWLDALRASTELSAPRLSPFGVPTSLGPSPLMHLGGVRLSRSDDPMRLLSSPGTFAVAPAGAARPIASEPRLEAAVAALHRGLATDEAIGSGVTLHLEPDRSTARVAITVTLGAPMHADWRRAPITDRAIRDTGGELRFTEVVRPTEIDVGISLAVGRLGLLVAQASPRSSSAVRARLNRHRRVALGQLPGGEAWLALGDLMFPPGDAAFGRLIDPRGPDGAWLRDRLLVMEQGGERRPSTATVTVAGHFDRDEVTRLATEAVARLGIGVGGRLPHLGAAPTDRGQHRRVLEVTQPRPELLVAFRLPGLEDDLYPATLVALELLAGSKRSLVREHLLDERLIDGYRARVDPDWDASVAIVSLTPALGAELASDRPAVDAALDDVLASLADEGPTGVQIAYAQAMVRARLGKRVGALARAPKGPLGADRLLESLRPGLLKRQRAAVSEVGRRAVKRALKRSFIGQPRWVVELRPATPSEVAAR